MISRGTLQLHDFVFCFVFDFFLHFSSSVENPNSLFSLRTWTSDKNNRTSIKSKFFNCPLPYNKVVYSQSMNIITKKWYLTIYTYTYTSQSFFNSVFISIAELVGKDLPIAEMFDSVKLVLIVVVHTVLFQKKGGCPTDSVLIAYENWGGNCCPLKQKMTRFNKSWCF